jgi:hypothetical protein
MSGFASRHRATTLRLRATRRRGCWRTSSLRGWSSRRLSTPCLPSPSAAPRGRGLRSPSARHSAALFSCRTSRFDNVLNENRSRSVCGVYLRRSNTTDLASRRTKGPAIRSNPQEGGGNYGLGLRTERRPQGGGGAGSSYKPQETVPATFRAGNRAPGPSSLTYSQRFPSSARGQGGGGGVPPVRRGNQGPGAPLLRTREATLDLSVLGPQGVVHELPARSGSCLPSSPGVGCAPTTKVGPRA